MKKLTLISIVFLFVFVSTANAQILDKIFKTADDVLKTAEKIGGYYNEGQKSFGTVTVVNGTGHKVEFNIKGSGLLNKDDNIILKRGQSYDYNVVMPMNTDQIHVSILTRAFFTDRDGDEVRVEVVDTRGYNIYLSRGSSQKYVSVIVKEKNEYYWIESY